MITASSFQDALIDEVRQSVRAMSDDVPVMLLPVRLETRFMTRHKPQRVEEYSIMGRSMEQIVSLCVRLFSPPAADLDVWYAEGQAAAQSILAEITNLGSLTKRHRDLLGSLAADLWKAANQLPASDPAETRVTDLRTACQQIVDAIQQIAPAPDLDADFTRTYLDDFRRLADRLASLAKGNIPFTNPKNKRDLYGFVEILLEQIKKQYLTNVWQAQRIKKLDKLQVNRILELHTNIRQYCVQLSDLLAPIHADGAWAAFVQRIRDQIQQVILPLLDTFQEQVAPLLHWLKDVAQADLTEMTYSAARLWIKAEESKKAEFKTLNAMSKARKQTLANFDAISTMSAKVLTGTTEQVNALQRLWQNASASMSQLAAKSATFETTTKPHTFAVQTSVRYFTETAPQAPGGFLQSVAVNSDALLWQYNITFLNSALANIQAVLAKAAAGASENVLHDDLEKISNDFRRAEQHGTFFTAAGLRDLNTAVKQLESAFGANGRFKVQLTLIRQAYNGFNAVVTDKKDQLYAQYHNRPILNEPGLISDELWVRIYPDNLAIQTHEPELTDLELVQGKKYWKNRWMASGDADLELGAWRALSSLFGAHRAAWVARILDPREDVINKAVWEDSPSRLLVAALVTLQKAYDESSKITAVQGPNDVFWQKIQTSSLGNDLQAARPNLLSKDREQVYLLQKAFSQISQIGSNLNRIVARLNGSTNAEKQIPAFINAANKTADWIEKLQDLATQLNTVVKVEIADFFAQLPEEPFVFPEVTMRAETYNKAPISPVMPSRFVVVTKSGGQFEHLLVGEPISPDLALGLKPIDPDNNEWQRTEDSELIPEPGIRWMTDFEEAVRQGMGVVIPLTQTQRQRGFDYLFALGIHDSSFDEGAAHVKDLLDSHHFSPLGMAFLPPGTPTNHTEEEPSGWVRLDSDPALSTQVEMGDALFPDAAPANPSQVADGLRLSNALGIPTDTFQHIYQAGNTSVSNAFAMHEALWPGTVGFYLTEMWNTVFTPDNVRRTAKFFSENVAGRGILPSLRIGRQPYGFLPVTAFSQLRFAEGFDAANLPPLTVQQVQNGSAPQETLQTRFMIRLHQFLQLAQQAFSGIRETQVKHSGNIRQEDPQTHFMQMLGLTATSVDYYARFAANISRRGYGEVVGSLIDVNPDAVYGANQFKNLFGELVNKGVFANAFEFSDELTPDANPLFLLLNKLGRIHRQFERAQIFRQKMLKEHYQIASSPVAPFDKPTDLLPKVAENSPLDYIGWLLNAMDNRRDLYLLLEGFKENEGDKPTFPARNPLFLLLKQSLLEALTETALDVLEHDGFFGDVYRRKLCLPEFTLQRNATQRDNYFAAVDRYSWLIKDLGDLNGTNGIVFGGFPLFQQLTAGERDKNMAAYLLNEDNIASNYPQRAQHSVEFGRLDNLKNRLRHLQTLPVSELTRLFAEHLDLCTHRLDAWISGFANQRLAEVRRTQPTGLYVGAYGWLTDLRPTPARQESLTVPEQLKGNNKSPILEDPENQGFIHAPSTGQAIAAAILRAGYRANAASHENIDNRFSVNLSSARVRSALYLLEGVRNGNELGAILGYQLERGLHEHYQTDGVEMDKYILPLRLQYPLAVPVEDTANQANATANVINGLTVLEEINQVIEGLDFPTGTLFYDLLVQNNFAHVPGHLRSIINDLEPVPAKRDKAMRALLKEIDRMADSLDALGDLAISESVYQLVQGNHVRAAAVVSALAEGKPIPQPQITDTPRSGTVVTHRVALHLRPISEETPTGWPATLTPRAQAEPALNFWLGEQMGDPANVRCEVTYTLHSNAFSNSVRLVDLGLQPLDVLYLVNFSGENAASELEGRVGQFFFQQPTHQNANTVKMQFTQRDSAWSSNILTFYEFETLVRSLREILATYMPLSASDLLQARDTYDRFNPGQQDDAELRLRAENSKTQMEALGTALNNWLADHKDWNENPPETADLTAAVSLSVEAAGLNIANAFPGLEMASSPKAMYLHLNGLAQSVQRNLDTINSLWEKMEKPELAVKDRITQLIEVVRTIFGKTFPVLPRFLPANFGDLEAQRNLPAESALLRHVGSDSLPMEEWLQGMAPVRPALFALDTFALLRETFGQTPPTLVPQQLPYRTGDYWLGSEYPEDWQPNGDRLSIVSMNATAFTAGQNCGLMVDEWVEIIPAKTETTAISFHYDQPNAEPPQTILLATTPQRTGQWEWDHLLHTLEDTLELAKNRIVEPDHLENSMFQHVLPALITESVPDTLRLKLQGLFLKSVQTDLSLTFARDAD